MGDAGGVGAERQSRNKQGDIFSSLKGRVLKGEWKIGEQLPTEVALADEYRCHRSTVSKALSQLAHEGLVERRKKTGTRVLRDRERPGGAPVELDAFAFIYPTEQHEGIWRTVKGFQSAANRRRRRVLTLTFGTDYQKEAELILRLREFAIRAAAIYPLISSPEEHLSLERMLQASPFPLVVIGTALAGGKCPTVTADDFHIGYAMTQHLAKGGARKIGFLSNHAWTQVRRDLARGYRWALEEAGLPARAEWILQEPSAHPDFQDPLQEPLALGRRFLRSAAGVEAVVCADDFLAQGLMRAAQEAGLKVPGDLRVSGVDDNLVEADGLPPLTSYRVPFEEMGARAFELLQGALDGLGPAELEHRLRGAIVARKSA